MEAKAEVGIKAFLIPKRSPDLNPCDYGLWSAVNARMRKQEARMPRSKKEARKEFIQRLHRIAKTLPKALVNRIVGDMQRRVGRLHAARGGLFEEGGRRLVTISV